MSDEQQRKFKQRSRRVRRRRQPALNSEKGAQSQHRGHRTADNRVAPSQRTRVRNEHQSWKRINSFELKPEELSLEEEEREEGRSAPRQGPSDSAFQTKLANFKLAQAKHHDNGLFFWPCCRQKGGIEVGLRRCQAPQCEFISRQFDPEPVQAQPEFRQHSKSTDSELTMRRCFRISAALDLSRSDRSESAVAAAVGHRTCEGSSDETEPQAQLLCLVQ